MVARVSVCPVRCLPCMCMVSCRSPLKIVSQSFSCYFPTLSPTLLSCMTQCTIMLLVGIVSITYLIRSFFMICFCFTPANKVWYEVCWSQLVGLFGWLFCGQICWNILCCKFVELTSFTFLICNWH